MLMSKKERRELSALKSWEKAAYTAMSQVERIAYRVRRKVRPDLALSMMLSHVERQIAAEAQ